MSVKFGRGALHLFGSAVIDQVVLSATSFAVAFLLIRFSTDTDYAMYVLVQSTLLLVGSAHGAWLMGPLAVLAPRLPTEERRLTIGAVKLTHRRWLKGAALSLFALPLAGYLVGLLTGLIAAIVTIGIVAAWMALRRDFLRSVLLIYSRPHTLLRADGVYALALLSGIGAAVMIGKGVIVIAVCALVVAAWAGAADAHRSLATDPGWRSGEDASIWPEIRALGFWSALGSTIYWFLGQSYSYVLAAGIGLKAVANVNASRVLMMPMFVLTIGVASLLGPSAATWYGEMGLRRLVRRLLVFLLVVGTLEATYFTIVWFARDWLVTDVLHKSIADRDQLFILWAAVAFIALVRDFLQCALTATGHFRSLAWQVGVSAALAMLIMWFGIPKWGAAAALIGQIVGELVNLAGILYLLVKSIRSPLTVPIPLKT